MFDSATSPYDNFCDGYGNPYSVGKSYILTLVVEVAKVKKKLTHDGSSILDEIIAFDKAEVANTNLGQINMINVSSFCGPNGLIWGYDLAKEDLKYLYKLEGLPIYSAHSLIKATRFLFGTIEKPNFPILPGSHVPCAGRSIELEGKNSEILYSAVGIGIPKERKNACVLMEDVGLSKSENSLDFELIEKIAKSIKEIGKNQNYSMEKALISVRKIKLEKNEIGSALVAAPYITIARKAVPQKGFKALKNLKLEEWVKKYSQ